MADSQRQTAAPAGGVLLSAAVFGALAGAGGFAWWLWRQSRQRACSPAAGALPTTSRYSGMAGAGGAEGSSPRDALPDRVQQLNQAIEEVRRQLESLQSQP